MHLIKKSSHKIGLKEQCQYYRRKRNKYAEISDKTFSLEPSLTPQNHICTAHIHFRNKEVTVGQGPISKIRSTGPAARRSTKKKKNKSDYP
jgi:hypothetical protein